MMIDIIIDRIRKAVIETFEEMDTWFDKNALLKSYIPVSKGWSIDQILEHTALTNHFLLILISKGAEKALNNAQKKDLDTELQNYVFHEDQLTEVGLHQSFEWIRPEHMEPTGQKTPAEVRAQLKEQVELCLSYLRRLSNGEGVLYKTTMSVNGLGKIDVYEYIYFLAQQGRRHITQMEKNERNTSPPNSVNSVLSLFTYHYSLSGVMSVFHYVQRVDTDR